MAAPALHDAGPAAQDAQDEIAPDEARDDADEAAPATRVGSRGGRPEARAEAAIDTPSRIADIPPGIFGLDEAQAAVQPAPERTETAEASWPRGPGVEEPQPERDDLPDLAAVPDAGAAPSSASSWRAPSSTSATSLRRRSCCWSCSTTTIKRLSDEAGEDAGQAGRLRRAGESEAMRYALGVEYDGSGFSGWQRLTRPGEPERATSRRCRPRWSRRCRSSPTRRSRPSAPGAPMPACTRRCQVVHFDSRRDARSARLGARHAPPACRRRMACAGACRWPTTSTRASRRARAATATASSTAAVRPALQRQYLSWERRPLDADAMHRGRAGAARRARFLRVPHRALPGAARAPRPAGRSASPRRRRGGGRGAGQRLPAPHGAQHRRHACCWSGAASGRRPGSPSCWPAATARWPARPRRRPGWCSSARAIRAHWDLPAESLR